MCARAARPARSAADDCKGEKVKNAAGKRRATIGRDRRPPLTCGEGDDVGSGDVENKSRSGGAFAMMLVSVLMEKRMVAARAVGVNEKRL